MNLSNHMILLAASTGDFGEAVGNRNMGQAASSGGNSYGFGDLGAIFDKSNDTWQLMDAALIKLYAALPLIAIAICVIIVVILCLLILRIYGMGNGVTYGALEAEVANFQRLQKRDRAIIRKRKQLARLTKMVNGAGLGLGEARKEYLDYNLKRAGVMGPSGNQTMTADEYNALIKAAQAAMTVVGVLLCVKSVAVGVGVALLGCLAVGKIPEMMIRSTVVAKDKAIKKDFFSFYGNIHYNIIRTSPTPIKVVVRNYANRELTPEMAEFVNNVADTFDLYGEYLGSKYVALDYRELPDVGKLMRMIQQYYDGGDVVNDMKGFRASLMLEKQMAMDEEGQRIAEKCRRAMILVFIILFQIVISTLANTLPDLMNFGAFM